MENNWTIHVVLLSLLGVLGLVFNAVYLASFNIKTRVGRTATELLQICKTVLVILALVIFMPMEISSVVEFLEYHPVFCVVKGFLGDLLFESQLMTTLAIAIVRLRVSFCKGQSAILIKKSSACITLLICLSFPTVCSIATAVFSSMSVRMKLDDDLLLPNSTNDFGICKEPSDIYFSRYKIFVFVCFHVLPVVITCSLYFMIYLRVTTQSTLSTARYSNVHENRKTEIKHTICILSILLVMTWSPYVTAECLQIAGTDQIKVIGYTEMVIIVSQPFAEGCLLKKGRRNICLLYQRICHRSKVDVTGRQEFEVTQYEQKPCEVEQMTEVHVITNFSMIESTKSETIMKATEDCSSQEGSLPCLRSSVNNVPLQLNEANNITDLPGGMPEVPSSTFDFDDLENRNNSGSEINNGSHGYNVGANSGCFVLAETDIFSSRSFSTSSQRSESHVCTCKTNRINPKSQEGRCRRHTLWKTRSSKQFQSLKTIFFEKQERESTINPTCDRDIHPGSKSDRSASNLSHISEYF